MGIITLLQKNIISDHVLETALKPADLIVAGILKLALVTETVINVSLELEIMVAAHNRLIVKSWVDYTKERTTVISIIIKHLFLSLKAEIGIQGIQDPKVLWEAVATNHCGNLYCSTFSFYKELFNIQMDKFSLVSAYVNKINSIISHLKWHSILVLDDIRHFQTVHGLPKTMEWEWITKSAWNGIRAMKERLSDIKTINKKLIIQL